LKLEKVINLQSSYRIDIKGSVIMLSDNATRKPGSGNVQVLMELDSKKEIEKINEKVHKKKYRNPRIDYNLS